MDTGRDGIDAGGEPKGSADAPSHLSERQRALRAVVLGAVLGIVMLFLGRRRDA